MLTTQSLTVMRQQKPLLHHINVTIEKGKIYALIGHNGSGKSTLIKALAGETTPTSGQIFKIQQDFLQQHPHQIDHIWGGLEATTMKKLRSLLDELLQLSRDNSVLKVYWRKLRVIPELGRQSDAYVSA